MDSADKEKIEKIIHDRKAAQTELNRKSPVYRAFLGMEEKTFADGDLSRREKELIAVGISVVINCESCMEWHIHQALLSGASAQQVMEAIETGIEMGGGPATVTARFALKALEYHLSMNRP